MGSTIREYIKPGHNLFLAGIGGVSMRALAETLHRRGLFVRGSDLRESDSVAHLRALGMEVRVGHAAENVAGADCLIRTAAVRDDNPEILAARERGIPVFERAEAWGALMEEYASAVCIAGTHGKTTTTAMLVQIALEAGLDPTAMIGGVLPAIGASYRMGDSGLIILESCEYHNSFLHFRPTVAAILNVEADHLDFFKDLDDVKSSFRAFAERTPESGCVVVNADDQNAMDCVEGLHRRTVTFGFGAADVRAEHLSSGAGGYTFDIVHPGGLIPVELRQPGRYNVLNALAAAACALELGVDGISIARGLGAFAGAGRRFEYKGEYNGAPVYDDYAHHPSELRALIDGVKEMGYSRVVAVFQPHTYTRTKALFDEFAAELRRIDCAFLLPIFAAREPDTGEVSSDLLAEAASAEVVSDIADAADRLRETVRPGDIVLTIGAGEAYLAAERLVAPEHA